MARSFRALAKWLVPGWLSDNEGGLVQEALCLLVDAAAARWRESLEARFPTRCGPSALALHSRERGILRGRSEADAHFAARLVAWRYPRGHRIRGNAAALLEQMGEYWGNAAAVQSIDRSGNQYNRSTAGAFTVSHGLTWTWDTLAASSWSRFWMWIDGSALFSAHPDIGSADLYGGAWDPDSDYTIGQLGATPADAQAMRRLVTGRYAWRPAGTWAEWLIVDLTGAGVTPDGAWERWSKVAAGVRSAARDATARYWSLAPSRNNTDLSDAALFTGAPLPGSGTYYDGDPTLFPLFSTSPAGSTLAGDPAMFPVDVQLLDDGDHL